MIAMPGDLEKDSLTARRGQTQPTRARIPITTTRITISTGLIPSIASASVVPHIALAKLMRGKLKAMLANKRPDWGRLRRARRACGC
jgi:hypothetical protein